MREARFLLNPYLIPVFFACVAGGALIFKLPEGVTAGIVAAFFAVATAANPLNGLAFIFLSTPFFLGESGWPWFWLLEVFIWGVLLSAAVHWALKRERLQLPLKYFAAFLLLTSAASVPIDGKEFYYELWATGIKEQFLIWLAAHPMPIIYYLRVLTNLATSLGIFALMAHYASKTGFPYLRRLFTAYAALAGVICVIAILMAYDVIPRDPAQWRYLSLSLVGRYERSITGFSYALHFFNQYLLLALPIAVGLVWMNRQRPVAVGASALTVILISFCVIQGGLRTAAMAFFMAVIVVIFILLRNALGVRYRSAFFTGAVGLLIIAALVGVILASGLASERFEKELLGKFNWKLIKYSYLYINDPLYFMRHAGIMEPRFFLWHTAVLMFVSAPLLGAGLGRFTGLFMDYYASDWYSWEDIGFAARESAHSIYFETLANQGIFGFILFFAFIATVLLAGFRRFRLLSAPDERICVSALLFTALMWLFLGLTHHVPLCRAIDSFFWITLGILAGLSVDSFRECRFGVKSKTILAGALAMAFGWQVWMVMERPIGPKFAAGFYDWEQQPDGTAGRWMGRRGVLMTDVVDGKVTLWFDCPLPGLDKNPQTVLAEINGATGEIQITSPGVKQMEIPASPGASKALVKISAGYVINPKAQGFSPDNRTLGVILRAKP
ncbi:MAG: O-antigen ligase family protein [Nitrospinae bacterium]|nr:O-antigen ligase family protein [Nitrospinota bacterium]